jgi:hypothetical protein
MKKSKLSIEKFTIAKLNNPSRIVGGDGDDQGETGKKSKCVGGSAIIVGEKEKED